MLSNGKIDNFREILFLSGSSVTFIRARINWVSRFESVPNGTSEKPWLAQTFSSPSTSLSPHGKTSHSPEELFLQDESWVLTMRTYVLSSGFMAIFNALELVVRFVPSFSSRNIFWMALKDSSTAKKKLLYSRLFFARFKKTQQGQKKKTQKISVQKNSRAILNKKLSVLESTWDFH